MESLSRVKVKLHFRNFHEFLLHVTKSKNLWEFFIPKTLFSVTKNIGELNFWSWPLTKNCIDRNLELI